MNKNPKSSSCLVAKKLPITDWMSTRSVIMHLSFIKIAFVFMSFPFFSFHAPKPAQRYQLMLSSLWVFVMPLMNIYVFLSKTAPGTTAQEGWFTWSCDHSWCEWIHEQTLQLQCKEKCYGFSMTLFTSVISGDLRSQRQQQWRENVWESNGDAWEKNVNYFHILLFSIFDTIKCFYEAT